MKEFSRKYAALFLVLLVILSVCLMFSARKSGMFIDEIYTYGLSNSHYAPFLREVAGGSLIDKSLSSQDILEYLTVQEGEGFDFGSVYYNQVNDVHPPLYYWLFNIASSFTPNVFSKWTGLILDLIIFMATVLLLYKLCFKLFRSRTNAAAAAAIYGLCSIGLTTMIMIRMYVLLALLTVSLAYLIACLMEKPSLKLCILVGLNIFLGLMTQYYFVFYAFFLCAAYLIYALIKKDFRGALRFSLLAFAGVGLLLLAFPACIQQLFADSIVSGGSAMENLTNFAQYKERLLFFFKEVRHGMKAAVYLSMLLVLLLAVFFKKLRAAFKEGRISLDSLVIILPAFLSFLLVAIISPVAEQRYVYNIIPIFTLAVCLLIYLLEQSLGSFRFEFRVKQGFVLFVLALSLWEARCIPPHYLYPEHTEYNQLCEAHADSPCVYLTDDYFAPVTQDLLQLSHFDEFFMTDSPSSPALSAYLQEKDAEECVVYIDVSAFWSSGFKPEEMLPEFMEKGGYTQCSVLYKNELSETYILNK